MKVLLVHNRYRNAGGEDSVYESERDMLQRAGVDVVEYLDDNHRAAEMNPLVLAAHATWARDSHRRLLALMRAERPDVVHFHNTFLMISPAAYYAARSAGVPVVQTLHNPRLICPAASGFRNGRPCSDCTGRVFAWPAVLHGCYRNSRAASAAVAGMIGIHRLAGTWRRMVDIYIALTRAGRADFIAGGLPADRIVIKPNGLYPDPGVGTHRGGYALFVGRLVTEKGVHTLVRAWPRVGPDRQLVIVGSGPLEDMAEAAPPDIRWLGALPRDEVSRVMADAAFLIFPSEGGEGFPMVILEAFAAGLPVITSGHGAMAEIVEHGRTGLHFPAGDPDALAAAVRWAFAHPAEIRALGQNARQIFEQRYTAAQNCRELLAIYELARERAAARVGFPAAATA